MINQNKFLPQCPCAKDTCIYNRTQCSQQNKWQSFTGWQKFTRTLCDM